MKKGKKRKTITLHIALSGTLNSEANNQRKVSRIKEKESRIKTANQMINVNRNGRQKQGLTKLQYCHSPRSKSRT